MTEVRHKCGDVREDGKVFWQYNHRYRDGEYWITKEKFFEYTSKRNAKQNERYGTDEDYRAARLESKRAKYCLDLQYRDRVLEASKARGADPLFKERRRAYLKFRRDNDPLYALGVRVRNRVRNAFLRAGYSKSSGIAEIIGCSFDDLKAHIESLFTGGMSWENRSEWHIDHIKPLAVATSEEELVALNRYTNLQPLWAKDNLSKGAKILN